VADQPEALPATQGLSRSKVVIAAVVIVAMVGAGIAYLVTSSKSSGSANAANASRDVAGVTPTTQGISFVVQPADGSTDVTPASVVSVTAMTGRLVDVTVSGSDGSTVAGTMAASGMAWQSTGTLAIKTDYTVTIDAMTPSGKPVEQETHFSSLVPTSTLGCTISPSTGLTVGVAEPIVFRFDHPVSAASQTAMLADLQVVESNPVAGGWRWFDDEELHFRPEAYWPTGEQVSVQANLAGFDGGNNIYATSNATTSFTVGDSHISTANVTTHEMTVTDNGKVVYTFPISTGRDIYPTMDGIHIDLYRQYDVHMVSSTVGIPVNSPNGYDEHVFWDVNISDGGEFVHAAPWSVAEQGHSNVSHGCINVSPANAETFYNFSRVGDVIDVTGSPRPPSLSDHGTMDWNTPWSDFTPAVIDSSPGVAATIQTTTTTVPAPTTTTAPPPAPTVPATTLPTTPATVPTTTTTVPATTTTTKL